MSRFYATVSNGTNKDVTRRGHATKGLSGHLRGWNIGVEVELFTDTNGNDVISIHKTGGSNNSSSRELITVLREKA